MFVVSVIDKAFTKIRKRSLESIANGEKPAQTKTAPKAASRDPMDQACNGSLNDLVSSKVCASYSN